MKPKLLLAFFLLITLYSSAQYQPKEDTHSRMNPPSLTLQKEIMLSNLDYKIASGYPSYIPDQESSSMYVMAPQESQHRDFSPEFGFALTGGYLYNRVSLGYIGLDMGFSPYQKYPYSGKRVDQVILGLGIYIGSFNGETKAIPTLNLTYSTGGAGLLDLGIAASQYHVNPYVGLNFANYIKIHTGYSFGFKSINDKRLKGFTIGIKLSIGSPSYHVDLST
ncbi:hypothetical protein M2451_000587 [Dysgonomonas sp. PFB1-18]|uniref:hypothetical protein n=1 Tax=unclassified Dysgonomonas TaxID=2630389 RepID=UPI0024759854|nr:MULTISPECIES: hypothetical protein [unclassified Dysgonomonas]MDH6307438.1 hypothetical protein [Dysgonomonas sp. PF1-14]MDH6337356.1 hypothetical protein [Dysgonomonas sp. PF1-16]MDH6379280.1 hypothetical protein [Dysgonomonas sp. PFB1-18]MDH6396082.1 hypothetical protein [Dysgonomonas sp. PF1-23]